MRVDCSSECVLRGVTGPCNCSSVHVKYLQWTFVGTSLLACAATTGMAHKVCVFVQFVQRRCSAAQCSACAWQHDKGRWGEQEWMLICLTPASWARAPSRTGRCVRVAHLSSFCPFLSFNAIQDHISHKHSTFKTFVYQKQTGLGVNVYCAPLLLIMWTSDLLLPPTLQSIHSNERVNKHNWCNWLSGLSGEGLWIVLP